MEFKTQTTFEPADQILVPESFNSRLILEVYVPGPLKAKMENAFASVSQRSELKGLKILVSTRLASGTFIPAGATAYIKEKSLHTLPKFKEILECDEIGQKFIIADLTDIEFIKP